MSARRPHPRRGRGTLLTIAALLLGSAALRIGLEAEAAFAETPDANTGGEVAAEEDPETFACRGADGFEPLIEALRAREARVAAREAEIEDRMHALSVADAEITRRLEELAAAEAALRETLAQAETAAENDLARLTAVYENMKPAEAAALFETMDPGFAAGFLGRMRPEAAAGVMAGLTPETAYTVSVMLAGRNAGAPRE